MEREGQAGGVSANRQRDREKDVVIVPHRPGPLRRMHEAAAGDPDGVEAILDELLGPDDEGGPGWFDLVLLVGGAALTGWGFISSTAAATVSGLAALGLGLILPGRAAWRALSGRSRRRRYEALLAEGTPLCTDHPAVAALADAYGAALGVLGRLEPGAAAGPQRTAHLAVLECATLLRGTDPATDAEVGYLGERTAALRRVAAAFDRRHEEGIADALTPGASAVVEARRELDRMSRFSTVEQLNRLADEAGVAPEGGTPDASQG